jgi:hypothetical protein
MGYGRQAAVIYIMICKYVHSKIPVCLVLTVTRANEQFGQVVS